jgi:hypothetical protein
LIIGESQTSDYSAGFFSEFLIIKFIEFDKSVKTVEKCRNREKSDGCQKLLQRYYYNYY